VRVEVDWVVCECEWVVCVCVCAGVRVCVCVCVSRKKQTNFEVCNDWTTYMFPPTLSKKETFCVICMRMIFLWTTI
jgi:hypothetical protein